MRPDVVTFWHGPLDPLRRLCLASQVAAGHRVTVYSFDPLAGLPAGVGNAEAEAFTKAFREKHKFDFSAAGFRTIFEYLQGAVNKAGSVDPTKIALAMEDLTVKDFLGFETKMRKEDHQIITEYFVGTFKKGVKYDAEGTGLGWATSATILAKDVDQPNTCKMKRPSAS